MTSAGRNEGRRERRGAVEREVPHVNQQLKHRATERAILIKQ